MKFFYTAMTHDRHRKCIIILFKKNKKRNYYFVLGYIFFISEQKP